MTLASTSKPRIAALESVSATAHLEFLLDPRLHRWLVNTLFGTMYTDLCYGQNAFWRRVVPHIAIECDGFGVETLISIPVVRRRLIVSEVPRRKSPRLHGDSSLRTFRDGGRVLRNPAGAFCAGFRNSLPARVGAAESDAAEPLGL